MGILDFLRSLWTGAPPGLGPAARQARTAPVSAFAGEIIDDLEASIGAAFDSVTGPGETAPGLVRHAYDDEASLELFASIASNYSRPVKNFILELRAGNASKDWVEICKPVMASIINGAASLGIDSTVEKMVDFCEALSLAGNGQLDGFDADSRQRILSCYDELVEALPATFVVGDDDRKRESILIHSLLRQIPEVGSVTLDKLYGAGLTSIEALLLATPDDVAAATSVPAWLCQRICDKVRDHRQQLESGSSAGAPLDPRLRLVEAVRELRRLQESFQRISENEGSGNVTAADKRECLRARQDCALQISVLLAEMGEVDLVEQLRKMAVERRVERLERYLAATEVGAAPILECKETMNDHHFGIR